MAILPIETDPIHSAKLAGLRYVSDSKPGIERKRWRKGFRYIGVDGAPVRDVETLARVKSLAIPPAWQDVWICPAENGHLQATGRDAKGRKQNRYHPRWRQVRDETKYERMLLFGEALPVIRKRLEHDLATQGLTREKVLATIVSLLEVTYIRIGNEEYAKQNQSYGLTTMRNRHVQIAGSKIQFKFKGKSGVQHTVALTDRRLAKIVKRCQDLPGYELFQYEESDGSHHSVDSADVNEYLRESTGEEFTAKDFRTWAGTVLACMMLRECEAYESQSQAKKNVLRAIEAVSVRLGNTPSVCRKCYVHPAVLECYMNGVMLKSFKKHAAQKAGGCSSALHKEEAELMQFLEKRLSAAKS